MTDDDDARAQLAESTRTGDRDACLARTAERRATDAHDRDIGRDVRTPHEPSRSALRPKSGERARERAIEPPFLERTCRGSKIDHACTYTPSAPRRKTAMDDTCPRMVSSPGLVSGCGTGGARVVRARPARKEYVSLVTRRATTTWKGTLLAAASAGTLAASSPALANGRYPESNQIAFADEDPDLVLLRVTFGLLVSHDRGRTFDWICEQSIGFSGIEDPMYTVTPSGAYVATTFQGVTITRDRGCSWSFAGGDLDNQVFIDLSSEPKDRKNIFFFASSYDKQDAQGNILFKSRVWETKDEAQTFQLVGPALDPSLLGYTIDVTRSDPNRLYVTAVRSPGTSPKAFLLTSKNHGQSWEEIAVPLEGTERAVFVAGVDPNDAERVYLRTSQGAVDKPTRLLVREATDGGPATLRAVHTVPDALLGFALSVDGSKVYVGSPKGGLYVANASDLVFQKRSSQEVGCLAVNPEGLWACSSEQGGFIAGVSKDDGATFEPRLHFCGVQGLLSCGPGSPTNDRCSSLWPAQRSLLGCNGDQPGRLDGGSRDGGDPGASSAQKTFSARGGSSCQMAPAGPWGALVVAIGLATALLRRSRRAPKA